jgi:phospholipase/carboxylesterase
MTLDPHKNDVVRRLGPPIEDVAGVVILLHGRGGSADDILYLAGSIDVPQLAYLAPQAAANSWYPNSFLAPIASNEPWLSSALKKVESIVEMVEREGVSASRIAIGGFSQGACLATEFVARHPQRYAALFALTGGLIGPPEADLSHAGNLDGTPAFFASSDPDPHVPWSRVRDSAAIFKTMGASVSLKRYEGRGHTISGEELDLVSELLRPAFGK